jgi:magnesium transporter
MMTQISSITTTSLKHSLNNSSPLHHRKKGIEWVHITTDSEKQLLLLFQKHKIHSLTIEDILNHASRVKLEIFPNYIFFIFKGFHFDGIRLTPRNFNFILTEHQIISITVDSRNTISDMIQNAKSSQELLQKGYEFIIHKIIDVETDHTLGIVQKIEEIIDQMEDDIFSNFNNLEINRAYSHRGCLQSIKKGINQNKEVLDTLEKIKEKYFGDEVDAFFRDVKDHSLKIIELVDSNIEAISSVLEAYLSMSTRKTNEIMKILTIMTAIMLPMSLVAGIFGMNFKQIPTLDWEIGFYLTLGIMTLLGLVMIVYFRIKKWF